MQLLFKKKKSHLCIDFFFFFFLKENVPLLMKDQATTPSSNEIGQKIRQQHAQKSPEVQTEN